MDAPQVLGAWSTFFVMIGSSAAALTGLTFVVTTLIRAEQASFEGVGTFTTPTVMHFACALLFSATLLAPWHQLPHVAVLVAIFGLSGLAYIVRVALRASRLSSYTPDAEDWIWYTIAPLIAYATILAAGVALVFIPVTALFMAGAGVLMLLFIGIRNAWDVSTYIAISRGQSDQSSNA